MVLLMHGNEAFIKGNVLLEPIDEDFIRFFTDWLLVTSLHVPLKNTDQWESPGLISWVLFKTKKETSRFGRPRGDWVFFFFFFYFCTRPWRSLIFFYHGRLGFPLMPRHLRVVRAPISCGTGHQRNEPCDSQSKVRSLQAKSVDSIVFRSKDEKRDAEISLRPGEASS